MQPPRLPRSKMLVLAALGLALLAVIAGTAALLLQSDTPATRPTIAQTTSSTAQNLPTTVPTTGQTSAPTAPSAPKGSTPTPHPAPGWAAAGPAYALNIAFAPSQAQTGYVCGQNSASANAAYVAPLAPHNSNPQQPLAVGVTHDGGATWTTYATPAQEIHCALSIATDDPSDIALLGDEYGTGCAPCGGEDLFVSMNGGQTWTQRQLPLEKTGDPSPPQVAAVAWAGTTLYATPLYEPYQGLPPHALAASINGGAFQWVNQSGLPHASGQPPFIPFLFSQGTTLYAVLNTGCDACQVLASTRDGVTWHQTSFKSFQQAWAAPNGTTLIALARQQTSDASVQDTLVASTDGGQTWHTYPALPGRVREVFVAPDGTTYAGVDGATSTAQSGIYRLLPGSTSGWVQVAAPPAANHLLAVQWARTGHPMGIWGQANFDYTRFQIGPGLQLHAP